MHVPFAGHQHELLLGELGVHQCKRHAVKREVPGGVPRILPLIGHRNDVRIIEVRPFVVAPAVSLRRRRRRRRIALQPVAHHVVIKLLGPEHSGERLPHDVAGVRREAGRDHAGVELIGLANSIGENLVEAVAECFGGGDRRLQP